MYDDTPEYIEQFEERRADREFERDNQDEW